MVGYIARPYQRVHMKTTYFRGAYRSGGGGGVSTRDRSDLYCNARCRQYCSFGYKCREIIRQCFTWTQVRQDQ
jgi:hypothetical protein